MKAKLFIAIGALAAMGWAATGEGAAHFIERPGVTSVTISAPSPVAAGFSVDEERGLLLRVWINQSGPFVFVLDTGAGMNVVSQRVVTQLKLATKPAPRTLVGGLSSVQLVSDREAILEKVSLGGPNNLLPSRQDALIVSNLPSDIDGILDPTEAYAPNGYIIDMPGAQISTLDSSNPNQRGTVGERAVVSWVQKAGDNRPFVRLGDGRLALVDTGSGFGLALNEPNAVIVGSSREPRASRDTRDIAGGLIRSRRVQPTTISIGEMVLRKIPTDILLGAHKNAPTILGRDALYPFKMSFDPKQRVIEFVATPTRD